MTHLLLTPADAGSVLRNARIRQGYSQDDVALAIDNTQSSVSDWERGAGIELASLLPLAAALGYHVALVPMPDDHPAQS